MRNLSNISFNAWTPPSDVFNGEPLTASCWDPARDEVLCTFGPSERDGQIRLARVRQHVEAAGVDVEYDEIASWEALSPSPDLAVDNVVSLHHFSDSLTTVLVLEGGDIVLVREPDNAQDGVHIEIMGSIDEGISAASWSPDEELLAISTKARTVVFMSRNFEGIVDTTMTLEDLKLSKQVSVGWGKKETQFQGRGAKALRDPTIPEKVDSGVFSLQDDDRITISWRGDGAYVAINSIEPGVRRVIRVYSRDGVLDSVSEAVDGMEGALSWRPAGNLLAGIQRKADGVDVIFFERNGLRHGQFSLRPSEESDLSNDQFSLEWNSDSTVLAVSFHDRVQLWTMGNYHYYLKQEIYTGERPQVFAWHPEKPLHFAATLSSRVVLAEYIFDVARGPLTPPVDYGAVAVVDGQTLKLTPFHTANIPPPMAMFEMTTKSAIADVAFSPGHTYMAVLHQYAIDLYQWQSRDARSLMPTLCSSFELYRLGKDDRIIPLQIAVDDDGSMQMLCYESDLRIHGFKLFAAEGRIGANADVKADSISGFSSLSQPSGKIGIIAQDRIGGFHHLKDGQLEPLSLRVPLYLPWTTITDSEVPLAFGLSRNGHLYANSRLLVKNCTSFLVTSDHLIFTTTNHLLKFVHRAQVNDLEVPTDDPENDERCRSIERGARLVTAMPTKMSLVLQMPRGNLETIYPRAMVLAGIRRLIEERNYGKAFAICRTQRVDMNILYDHKPQQFLEHINLFLNQLEDVTYIDLFLSSLRNDDVTQTMYRDTKPTKTSPQPQHEHSTTINQPASSKVNTICDAVLASLQSRRKIDNGILQNIITANVCKDPPALEDGLLVVAKMMEEDEGLAESAVEHICFLTDVNTLYDEALGLYNLDLALLVAQQSQRDPREYLPFIQSLHQLPDLRRKFSIDDHLGRHTKALSHLQALHAHEEAQDYTVKHALYADALRLYRYDAPNLATLTHLHATYLESRSKFREAGLAYESLHDYAAATRCYRSAGSSSWREALFTASLQQPPLSESALNELASDLANALWEAKDYSAAATIYLEHLSNLAEALRCLCKGYLFADALRLIALHHRPELLESSIDSGLTEALSSSTDFLADCKAQLRAQVPRILELRRKAAEDPLAFYEGERAGGVDIPDDISVAASSRMSTNMSLFTRYTGSVGTSVGTGVSRATSKNRRREEKKRARGRKGTVYEEEYLVNSVRRLVERVESTKEEVERLVFGLVRRGMVERARAVETLMGEVVEGSRKATGEVWGPREGERNKEEQGKIEGKDEEGEWRATGADAVLAENLEMRWRTQEPPVVKGLERLSLLGS